MSISGLNEGKEAEVKYRFSVGAGVLVFDAVLFPFSGLSSKDLYVPPHPDDVSKKGSKTEPIRLRDNYHVSNTFPFGFFLEGGIFLTHRLRLKDKFTVSFNPGMLGIGTEAEYRRSNIYGEGNYEYPPFNRQQYASGEKAYTFVSIGNIISNFLDLELYLAGHPQSKKEERAFLPLQMGIGFIALEHIYGWDRYGNIEFESKEYDYYPGLHVGTGVLFLHRFDKIAWATKILSVDFRIGFTDDIPVIMLELTAIPYLSNGELFF